MRLLFVDDEPRVLSGIERAMTFAPEEWEADFATSATEAFELLAAAPYDVLVTDMKMPHLTGADVLEQAKIIRPTMIRIILSGEIGDELAQRAIPLAHEFVSKPCDLDDLFQIIDRIHSSTQNLRKGIVEALLNELEFPQARPELLAKVQQAVDDGTSTAELAAGIESDLALTSAITRTANSAFYGFKTPALSVEEAVTRLGLETVSGIAMLGQFTPSHSPEVAGLVERLNQHAVTVSHRVRALVGKDLRQAGLAAMLHDVGLLILLCQFPDRYASLLNQIDLGDSDKITGLELEQFGVHHADVGAAILAIWHLDPVTVEVARLHHDRQRADGDTRAILDAIAAAEWVDHPESDPPTGVSQDLLDRTRRLVETAGR